ncbi:MAG: FkbM family methyltransferase [Phycisphaerae bacterium]|nr:FkbM family methyltransferase [Phycisphaerae bacterium]
MSWKTPLRHLVRRFARRQGYDLVEYPPLTIRRRARLLANFEIDLLLDVGADTGEYVQTLRARGYTGRVVSFEPLSASFAKLRESAADDPRWETVNVALGDRDGRAVMHVAGNMHSSSLRDMQPAHLEAAPHSAYVGTETVTVRRLDALFDEYRRDAANVFMKIDTQGYEQDVLAGAARTLPQIAGLQLEMSLVELYGGQMLFPQLCELIADHGFTLMSLEPGFANDRTGQLLQVDGVFFRLARPLKTWQRQQPGAAADAGAAPVLSGTN